MLVVDIVLIVILAAFAMSGAKSGFIQTLGQLIGAILGFIAARAWSPWLTGFFAIFLPGHVGIAHFIAFIIIFVIIDRLVGFLFKLADGVFRILTIIPFLSTINSLLGLLLGFAEGVVLVGSSVYLILSLRLDPTLVNWLSHSSVAGWTETAFYRVLGFLL